MGTKKRTTGWITKLQDNINRISKGKLIKKVWIYEYENEKLDNF